LRDCGGVAEFERQPSELKEFFSADKGGFWDIFLSHLDLMAEKYPFFLSSFLQIDGRKIFHPL